MQAHKNLTKTTTGFGLEQAAQFAIELIIAELGLLLFAVDVVRGLLVVFGYFFGAIIAVLPQAILDLSEVDETLLKIENFLHKLAEKMPHTQICKKYLGLNDKDMKVFWLLWCVSSIFRLSMSHWAFALFVSSQKEKQQAQIVEIKKIKRKKKTKSLAKIARRKAS